MRGFVRNLQNHACCVESSGHWVFLSLSQRLTVCCCLPSVLKDAIQAVSYCLCCTLVFLSFARLCTASTYISVSIFFPVMKLHGTNYEDVMVEMHHSCSAWRSGWASYTLLDLNWHIKLFAVLPVLGMTHGGGLYIHWSPEHRPTGYLQLYFKVLLKWITCLEIVRFALASLHNAYRIPHFPNNALLE